MGLLVDLAKDAAANRVQNEHSGDDVLQYCSLNDIEEAPNNNYSMSGIEELATNILFAGGLQQPLRLRKSPAVSDKLRIISGHRRRAALQLLVNGFDGEPPHPEFDRVPYILDTRPMSEALAEFLLICGNKDTRQMSGADLHSQAQRVEALLYQLKEEGITFPGRMREQVAEACSASASRLAKLKVIHEKMAIPAALDAFKTEKIAESTAYALAKLPAEEQTLIWQQAEDERPTEYEVNEAHKALENIGKIQCMEADGGPCEHRREMFAKIMAHYNARHYFANYDSDTCGHRCCKDCGERLRCGTVCELAAAEVSREKQQKKEAERETKEAEKRAAQAAAAQFGALAGRAYEAARRAGVDTAHPAADGAPCLPYNASEMAQKGAKQHPFNYCSADSLTQTAKRLGVSLDYLFGLTDDPRPAAQLVKELKKAQDAAGDAGEDPRRPVTTCCAPAPQQPEIPAEQWAEVGQDAADDARRPCLCITCTCFACHDDCFGHCRGCGDPVDHCNSYQTEGEKAQPAEAAAADASDGEDPRLHEAEAVVREAGFATVTLLQKKLRCGYAEGARLMDALERAGVIGPYEGASPRKVLKKQRRQTDEA